MDNNNKDLDCFSLEFDFCFFNAEEIFNFQPSPWPKTVRHEKDAIHRSGKKLTKKMRSFLIKWKKSQKLQTKIFAGKSKKYFYLFKVNGDVDFFVLHASRKRRTLPPAHRPVDHMFGRMAEVRLARVAILAVLAALQIK